MITTLKIDGDFDATCVERLKTTLEQLAEDDADIDIDLSQSNFLDSSGVGAIVFLYKRAKARGYFVRLTGAKGQPIKLLQHLGIASILATEHDQAA